MFCTDCTDGPNQSQVERHHITAVENSLLITKFSPDGSNILHSTYFNSPDKQQINLGINSAAVSDSGEVAFGLDRTDRAGGLPLVNHTQTHSETTSSVYVAKLNSAGNALVFGTYLTTGGLHWLRGLDVSSSGEVAATGMLGTDNSFPEINSIAGQSCTLNPDVSERSEGFITLFDSAGNLTFASCLGGEVRDGSSTEGLRGVTFGSNGDLYALGYSSMTDFPVVNPIQATKNVPGAREMTISQIDPNTSTLVFSTYFGPTSSEITPDYSGAFLQFFPIDIKTDSGGNIIVAGPINSLSYPTVNAVQTNLAVPRNSLDFRPGKFDSGALDIFVTKIHPDNGVIFSTYLGGSRAEGGFTVLAIDGSDDIYVASVSFSDDYPVLFPIQGINTGDSNLALSKLTAEGALAFSTYLGGSNDGLIQAPGGLAVNAQGRIILASYTQSDDYPIFNSGTSRSGDYDIILSIIDQSLDSDSDGDGVIDPADAFPNDAGEWRDTDGDLTGDNADSDDDGDGEPDISDRFPLDASEQSDADEDGAGDNLDQFDADPENYYDLDDDGTADFADTDADGDLLDAPEDQFDYDATETTDTDSDGIGDNTDSDDDNDGRDDVNDQEPLNSEVPVITFENYRAWNTDLFKSPWPDGFSDVAGADLAWTSAEDQSHNGNRSFSNHDEIEHGQTAAIQYSGNYQGGTLQFWYKVDSQENSDQLVFSMDSNVLLTESGDTGWQVFSTAISPGAHTLEWRYEKDGSGLFGPGCCMDR